MHSARTINPYFHIDFCECDAHTILPASVGLAPINTPGSRGGVLGMQNYVMHQGNYDEYQFITFKSLHTTFKCCFDTNTTCTKVANKAITKWL